MLKKNWKKKPLTALRHYQLQLHYPQTIDLCSGSHLGHQNLGETMKTRHAQIVLMICLLLTSLLGSAPSASLEPLAVSSKRTASTPRVSAIITYPQAVDNSPNLRISLKTHAYQLVTIWFGVKHWKAFNKLVWLESRWNYKAFNKQTNAYGLTQIIGSKRYAKDRPYLQLLKAMQYIAHRYKTPTAALKHLKQRGWH